MVTVNDVRHINPRATVGVYQITQQSWSSGESDAKTTTLANLYGKCEQIEVKLNDNTNNVTATVAITTADSGTLFSQAGIAEDATTVYKATSDATDFDAFLCGGTLTFTITPSGDPGASGLTVDVILYLGH